MIISLTPHQLGKNPPKHLLDACHALKPRALELAKKEISYASSFAVEALVALHPSQQHG